MVKKSSISEFLLSEKTVLICTVMVCSTAVILLGIILQYSIRFVCDIDIVEMTLFHMDLDPRWRYHRLTAAHRRQLFRSLFDEMHFITFYDLILCNEMAASMINVVIVGQCAISVIGILHSVAGALVALFREGRLPTVTMHSIFIFIFVAVNKVFALRVGVPVGCQYVSNKVRTVRFYCASPLFISVIDTHSSPIVAHLTSSSLLSFFFSFLFFPFILF